MSEPEPTITAWCCGDCDTWNDVAATSCMVCEAPVRPEWLERPVPVTETTSRPTPLDPGWGVRPTPSAPDRSSGLNVPLDPVAPPVTTTPGTPPPSIAALLAKANEPDDQPTPLPTTIVMAAVAVAVVALIVLAVIALQ